MRIINIVDIPKPVPNTYWKDLESLPEGKALEYEYRTIVYINNLRNVLYVAARNHNIKIKTHLEKRDNKFFLYVWRIQND
jgi:hypothetical protein